MSTLKVNTVQHNTSGFNNVVQFTDGGGTENGVLCRAWANFNGQGTVALRADFNVNSITDVTTGGYHVNFANDMPDANYSWSLNGGAVYNGSVFTMTDGGGSDNTTRVLVGSLGMQCRGNGNSFSQYDSAYLTVSIFR